MRDKYKRPLDLRERLLVPRTAAFMFRLTRAETEALNRSQFVTGSQKHRDPRFPSFAFTEHGAIMAATILNSPRAVEMSVFVVRAFVRLRELLASNTALARKLDELERKYLSWSSPPFVLKGHRSPNDPARDGKRLRSGLPVCGQPPRRDGRGIRYSGMQPVRWRSMAICVTLQCRLVSMFCSP
jgi:hypothetical protein